MSSLGIGGGDLLYYDRRGKLIDNEEWMKLFEDPKYKILRQQVIHGNKVSTVWLGTDHSFGTGPVLIFETLVFGDGLWGNYQRRWTTEADALLGHSVICDAISWWFNTQVGVQEWVRVRDPSNHGPADEAHRRRRGDHEQWRKDDHPT